MAGMKSNPHPAHDTVQPSLEPRKEAWGARGTRDPMGVETRAYYCGLPTLSRPLYKGRAGDGHACRETRIRQESTLRDVSRHSEESHGDGHIQTDAGRRGEARVLGQQCRHRLRHHRAGAMEVAPSSARSRGVRTSVSSQIEPTEWWREDDEMRFDRVPGMPLVGFFAGSFFSLGIWSLLVWAAWHFVG